MSIEIIPTMRLNDDISNYDDIVRHYINCDINTIRFNITRYSMERYWTDITYIQNLYKINGRSVKIMLDLPCPGSKYRIKIANALDIVVGEQYTFSGCVDRENEIYVPGPVIESSMIGGTMILGDGELAFKIIENKGISVNALALNSGTLRNGRAVYISNFSNYYFKEYRQEEYGELISRVQPNYVALSFAEDSEQINLIRRKINRQLNNNTKIVSKIETLKGADAVDQISEVSDVIMIGRGDLALTCESHRLGFIQDEVISKCHNAGKEVFVATDVLNSLLSNYVPRRSDILDVHHLVLNSVDGIVLSAALSVHSNFERSVSFIKDVEQNDDSHD